jgi:hypothetical protein
MERPLIKALWFLLIRSSSLGASRFANILETSFGKLWIRHIGL